MGNAMRPAERLRGGLFLSSMMGVTTGAWCAAHGRGAAMVQMGAYVLDAPEPRAGGFWPDSRPEALAAHLRAEFEAFRSSLGGGGAPLVSANVFLCEEKSVETSARAFTEAGGDLYELNVHGGIGGDRERGTGRFMFLPEHAEKLHRWVARLAATGVPLIVKAKSGVRADYAPHLERFEEAGVLAFHVNVRDEARGAQDLAALEAIRARTGLLLLASGYATDMRSVRRLFDAGADAVGIAEAARRESGLFLRLAAEARAAGSAPT